jgi:hypothetical protein
MKKLMSVTMLSFATALFGLAQFGCASPQPTASTNANMSTPAPTPDKAAIEVELTKIENDWPRIMKEHDATTVRRIEADDAVFVYPDGSAGNKEQDIKDMESGALSFESWDVTDIKVNVLDNDAAVVSGRSIIKGGKYKMPDGSSVPFPSDQFRWVDTYVRRNGQWQQVAGAITPVMKGAAAPTTKPSPSPSTSPAMKASPAAMASPTAKAPAMKATPAMKPAATPAKTKTP